MDDLYEQVTKLEIILLAIEENHLTYQLGVDAVIGMVSKLNEQQKEQEKDTTNLKAELDASFNRASSSSDREDKTVMITNLKGFYRLKSYLGDVSQWKD